MRCQVQVEMGHGSDRGKLPIRSLGLRLEGLEEMH